MLMMEAYLDCYIDCYIMNKNDKLKKDNDIYTES